MKVLVCGGRDYWRSDKVWESLDVLNGMLGITEIVHGAATGADTLAGEWARMHGLPEHPYPIEAGESGYDRNGRMLLLGRPDLVVHFPGGTADMVDRAKAAGVPVLGGLEPPEDGQRSLAF